MIPPEDSIGGEHAGFPACPNCGTGLEQQFHYCPHCGQPNHNLRVPLRHLLMEAAEDLLHFDSKSFRTLRTLMLQPGRLSAEFCAGRRVGYVSPIRLYVFLSFLFFLLLSLGRGGHTQGAEGSVTGPGTGSAAERNQINITFYGLSALELRGLSRTQIDSLMNARGIALTPFTSYLTNQMGRFAAGGRQEFNHVLVKGVSYMMFVLMPLFALFVWLFYRKTARYYLDSLVFSVHFHSFAFLLFALYLIVSWLTSSVVLLLAAALIIAVYLFFALRTMFRQSKKITLLKCGTIGMLHLISIGGCFFITVLASILLF